jgi:hypothetical protein
MKFILILLVWMAAMTIVGCNDAALKKSHPIATEIVETSAKDVEEVLEPIVDAELHLPSGASKAIVDEVTKELDR